VYAGLRSRGTDFTPARMIKATGHEILGIDRTGQLYFGFQLQITIGARKLRRGASAIESLTDTLRRRRE
jgi:hypothetical protein